MLTMCQFTLCPTWYLLSKGSSQVGSGGQARFGLETLLYLALNICSGPSKKTKKTSKQIHSSSFSPHFPLIFLIRSFLGPIGAYLPFFFTPRSPETTSEIPEWVCGRSTVASGLTAPHFAKLAHGIFITVYISFLISFIFIHRWFLNIIHQASQSIRSTLEASAKRAHLSTT